MRGHTRTGLRIGAYVASGALALSGAVLAVTPAQAATHDPAPAASGATWLAGQLTNGVFNGSCSYDCGNTIDAGLSLIELGGQGAAVTQMKNALPGFVESYITGEAFDDTGSTYAGPAAKSLVFAETAGLDATSYGGVDLVDRVENQVTASGVSQGRLFDTSMFGDYANTLGQALAVGGLKAAASLKVGDVTDFLLKQQCSTGYFRLYFTAEKTAADQTCEGGRASGDSAPDTDATALAVLMVANQEETSNRVARALGRAESWLLSAQKADGSFGGGTSTTAANANSTGLAGRALAQLGDLGAASDAAVWTRQHQAADLTACPTQLAGQTGAIALNDAALAEGRSVGITSAKQDQWRRASVQALPVLQWAPAVTSAPSLTGPAGYLKARSVQRFAVSGAVPGDTVCLTGASGKVSANPGIGGSGTIAATLPAGTANRTITVTDRAGNVDTVTARVLGSKSLVVGKAKGRAKRSTYVTATVYGLANGEAARISYKGRVVKTGKANSLGRFAARFNVGRQLGNRTITAVGQFADIRRGSTTVKVVR